jgi:hypothetical protein
MTQVASVSRNVSSVADLCTTYWIVQLHYNNISFILTSPADDAILAGRHQQIKDITGTITGIFTALVSNEKWPLHLMNYARTIHLCLPLCSCAEVPVTILLAPPIKSKKCPRDQRR